MPLSIRLWRWKCDGHLPPDFLEYPAQIVDEVEFLDSIAPSVRDEIESRRKKEERKG